MANNLTIAWAMPVDSIALGASIEAYASAKSTQSAFLDFIEMTSDNSAARRLPNELLEKITTHALRLHFEEHTYKWGSLVECFCGSCPPSEHLREEEYKRLKEDFKIDQAIEDAKYSAGEGSDENTESERQYIEDDLFNFWLREHRVGPHRDITLEDGEHLRNITRLQLKIGEGFPLRGDDLDFKRARKVGRPQT